MGLLDRLTRRSPQMRATALVIESSSVKNVEHASGVHRNDEVRENALNQFNLGKIPHDLTLEVRMPDRPPFTVTQRVGVPAKATGRQGYRLPVGIELPITYAEDNPQDFDIDWNAFLDSPDRKAAVQQAAANESRAQATAYTQSVPGLTEKTWASAAAGVPNWMEAVRTGKMKRKAFNTQVDTLSRIGQMDPELAIWSKQTLDAEGFSL
jgi:hypothetical protein